ncbi:MAG TPA: hypothetical protein VGL39_27385 [Jatrophihabitantaceae bacterium]
MGLLRGSFRARDRRLLLGLPVLAVALAGCSSSTERQGAHSTNGVRPSDACTMLTSDQVSDAVGTPGPYTGATEDAAEDGSPVWGCTWGTQNSYADIRETSASHVPKVGSDSVSVTTRLSGIGNKAVLQTFKGGGEPYVFFAAAGRSYEAQVTVDRRELDATNSPRETSAAQELAKILAKELSN